MIHQNIIKNLQQGRSMVEMLGVLAIIAVLSVGSLAGYQKAIFKYRLNKYSESISIFLNTFISIMEKLPQGTWTEYSTIFKNMSLIPDHMTYKDEGCIKDIFGNCVRPYSLNSGQFAIIFTFTETSQILEVCKTLTQIVKERHSEVTSFYFQGGSKDILFAGDDTCTAYNTCLRNLSLNTIYSFCQQYIKDSPEYDHIQIQIYFNRNR